MPLNPLTPRRTQISPLTEISILFKEGIIKKISYERRAYESVAEKSLSKAMSRKTKKKNWSIKAYRKWKFTKFKSCKKEEIFIPQHALLEIRW